MDMKPLLKLTDAAAAQVRTLVETGGEGVIGLKIGVSSKGCSGMSYMMDYARPETATLDRIELDGAVVFIDPAAMMFLIGTEIDYEKSEFQEGFVFRNPNEKSRCGCGESFSV